MTTTFKYQHGLTIMRCQPLHVGHMRIIDQMLRECQLVTILLGSIQEHGTLRNPLNFTSRKKMLQLVYRDQPAYERMWITGIQDIFSEAEWANFVLATLHDLMPEVPKPDVYYGGAPEEGAWFTPKGLQFTLVDRTDSKFPYVSGTMIREMWKYRDQRWRHFVPEAAWKVIDDHLDKKGDAKLRAAQ